jgi:hypothetical protein
MEAATWLLLEQKKMGPHLVRPRALYGANFGF